MFLTPSTTGNVLLLAIVGLIAGHSWHLYRQGRWLMLDPLNAFWAGILVVYIQQPIASSGVFISWHSEAVFDKTLFATLFGLVFVVAGYEMSWGLVLAKKIPQPPARLNSGSLLLASLVLMALGLVEYAYIINLSGGLNEWLSVGRGGTNYEKVQGYWPMLTELLPAGVAMLLFRANLHRISTLGKILAWLAAGLMWWWFLYLGTRSHLIAFTILMLAAFYLPRHRNPNVAVALGAFLALQIIVSFQENYRGYFTSLSFNLKTIDKQEMWHTILPDFLGGDSATKHAQLSEGAEFNCAMAVVELVPDRVPYNHGYGFLEFFTRPIPRAIWPNKPYPHLESVQGVLREGNLSDSNNQIVKNQDLLMGPAFAFVGYWYYVGGFVALIIGGLITGTLLRLIRGFYELGSQNEGTMITYPFLIVIGFSEAASTPFYWVYTLPFILLPYIVAFYLCREDIILPRDRRKGRRQKRGELIPDEIPNQPDASPELALPLRPRRRNKKTNQRGTGPE